MLDRIAALARPDRPVLAEVTQTDDPDHGPLLYVGLHQDGEPLRYTQGGSDREFPPNSEISADLIRRATHEFADTGLRPACVAWQRWDRAPAGSNSEWPEL